MGCAQSAAIDETPTSEAIRRAEAASAELKAVLTSSEVPPHFGLDALLASVETGAIAPLRGSWLIACHERGERLQRRQDLPNEAFFDTSELRKLAVALGMDYGLLFVALSYRWLSSAHPDPDGYTLGIVADVCKIYLDDDPNVSPLSAAFLAHGIPLAADCAVFWDFGSLFQRPRSAAEEVLFLPGLKASNVWYGHEMTVCWMQTSLPAGFAFPAHLAQTYDESGWCFVEAAISAGVKLGTRRLDLAKRTKQQHAYAGHWPPMERLDHACAALRLPPLLPDTLHWQLVHDKTFTSGADVDVVDKLYRAYFNGVSAHATRLDFGGLGWRDTEATRLAETLPCFARLTSLNVACNMLGDASAALLARFLRGAHALTELDIRSNPIIGVGASELAEATLSSATMAHFGSVPIRELRENRLTRLDLSYDGMGFGMGPPLLGPVDTLVAGLLLKANDSLTELDLRNNILCGVTMVYDGEEGWEVGTYDGAGLCAIAEALRGHRSLKCLRLQGNCIHAPELALLREAAVAAGQTNKRMIPDLVELEYDSE